MSGVRLLAQGQEMKLKVKLFWQVKKGKRSVHNGYASVIYSTGWSPAQDNGANQTDNCKHTHMRAHTHRKKGKANSNFPFPLKVNTNRHALSPLRVYIFKLIHYLKYLISYFE